MLVNQSVYISKHIFLMNLKDNDENKQNKRPLRQKKNRIIITCYSFFFLNWYENVFRN